MSERVDNFCNEVWDHLNAIEGWLDRVKSGLRSASDETREVVESVKGI